MRYSLGCEYVTQRKKRKNQQIIRVILETKEVGEIEFNIGKIWTKSHQNIWCKFSSNLHHYNLKIRNHIYGLGLLLEDGLLNLNPRFEVIVYDSLNQVKIVIKQPVIKIYLTKTGYRKISKVYVVT